jgi:hypothetical protein
MAHKTNLTRVCVISATLLVATVVFTPAVPSAAQDRPAASTEFSAQQEQQNKGQQKKAAPAGRAAPQRAAPQRAAPRVAAPQRTAPRTVTQTKTQSRVVRQPTATSRTVRQPKSTSRAVTQPKATSRTVRQPTATKKVVAPSAVGRNVVSPAAAPRVVTPTGTRTVTASRLRGVPVRGAGSAVIRGQNYSAWRSGYRVRHGDSWWTFVALSTLGAIAIGANQYYPYAYISAPQPYCEGLTEDGCELMWQEVQTIEGEVVNQCVAYCPWQ